MTPEMIFAGVFLAVGGFIVYRIVRYKGLRGAAFGAEILSTIGEVRGVRQGPMSVKVKVHSLGGQDPTQNLVGLELVTKGPMSWQMMPITLSAMEAQRLITLLQQAAGG